MRILFVADVVGKAGRRALRKMLPVLCEGKDVDVVIVNCENAAAGFGVTRSVVEELYESGAEVLTSGNHIWDKRDFLEIIDDYETLLRPANYPTAAPGRGALVVPTRAGVRLGVLNLAGRVFMQPLDCPFGVAEREIARMKMLTNIIFVDMHAEATSEKSALAWYLDGKVSAVIGTHTHVQTADERILPQGTAFLSDAGMTGAFDSIIGMEKDEIIAKFIKQIPVKFEVATADVRLQGVLLDVDDDTGKAVSIERISECLTNYTNP